MNELKSILDTTISLSMQKRPEVLWIQEKYALFMKQNGLSSKTDADTLLYEKMYGILPKKQSELVKIRFWRTGQHIPATRDQANLFSLALSLSEKDSVYLLQHYMDRSDLIFSAKDIDTAIYRERLAQMNLMIDEYLMKLYPLTRIELGIHATDPLSSLRHIYFNNVLDYCSEKKELLGHPHDRIESISYGSEFLRNIRLIGEAPRKTVLRHILLMCIPFVNQEVVNHYLLSFGYRPLQENHTLTGGERLDYALIHLLNLYEKECNGTSYFDCIKWLKSAFTYMDQYMKDADHPALRLFFFKSLISK